jgi:hypothetical protein
VQEGALLGLIALDQSDAALGMLGGTARARAICKPWTTVAAVCGQLRSPYPENQPQPPWRLHALRVDAGIGSHLSSLKTGCACEPLPTLDALRSSPIS